LGVIGSWGFWLGALDENMCVSVNGNMLNEKKGSLIFSFREF